MSEHRRVEIAGRRSTVLVVDDDADFASEVEAVLSDEYNVHLEQDSEGALACVRHKGIDLAIIDIDLPPFLGRRNWDEGLILIRLLATEHHIPVVVITNSNDEMLLGESASAGARSIESKDGIQPDRLRMLVSAHIKRVSR